MIVQENPKIKKTKFTYPFRYSGNLIIFIILLIIWLPLGLILWMKNGSFVKENSKFYINYHGSYFWLFFWAIIFFPISIILLLVNGADWIEEVQDNRNVSNF